MLVSKCQYKLTQVRSNGTHQPAHTSQAISLGQCHIASLWFGWFARPVIDPHGITDSGIHLQIAIRVDNSLCSVRGGGHNSNQAMDACHCSLGYTQSSAQHDWAIVAASASCLIATMINIESNYG